MHPPSHEKSTGRSAQVAVGVAFLLVLLAPLVFSAASRVRGSAAATPPGQRALELRLITPHQRDIRLTFARAFSDWHEQTYGSPVRLTFVTPGGTGEIVRYLRNHYEALRTASGALKDETAVDIGLELIWGGGDLVERELKDYLKPLTLAHSELAEAFPSTTLAGVPLLDPAAGPRLQHPPRWVGVALSSFGIVYNPELYSTLKLPPPTNWDDLARPELHRLLTLADPTHSGAATMTYMMVLQSHMALAERAYADMQKVNDPTALRASPGYAAALDAGWARGMHTLVLMGANSRYFSDSGGRPANDVGQADAAAGVAIDFYARVYQDSVGSHRVAYYAPRAATAVTPDTIAVLYGTLGEREVLANRFVSFSLSPDGQRLWTLKAGASPYVDRSLRRLPIRRDVYSNRQDWADDIDPFEQVGTFNLRSEWLQGFRETRLLIATLWLDAGSALQSAHNAVMRVSEPSRRADLRRQLAEVPITRQEVYRLEQERKNAERDPETGSRLLLTQQRVQWAARFRQHFRNVQDTAAGAP